MSFATELKKELALKAQRNQNLSINQVPVQTVNTVAPVAPVAPVKLTKEQKFAAAVQAEVARVLGMNASQIPVQAVAPQVVMTHLSAYPAGISKRTGKAYPAGYKWHAKAHPMGSTAYGGLSMDDIGAMLMNFDNAEALWTELNGTFDKYGKTSNLYKKSKETIIDLNQV